MFGDGHFPKFLGTESNLKNPSGISMEGSTIGGKSRLKKLVGNPGPRHMKSYTIERQFSEEIKTNLNWKQYSGGGGVG